MREERKERARRDARVDALNRVADRLRSSWLMLDQHHGLEHLAEPTERALDAVEAELAAQARGEDELDLSREQLEAGLEWEPEEEP